MPLRIGGARDARGGDGDIHLWMERHAILLWPRMATDGATGIDTLF